MDLRMDMDMDMDMDTDIQDGRIGNLNFISHGYCVAQTQRLVWFMYVRVYRLSFACISFLSLRIYLVMYNYCLPNNMC